MNDIIPEKKNGFKELFLDVKKFLWYLVTEPFRIIRLGFLTLRDKISVVQKIKAWMVVFGFMTLLSIMARNHLAAEVFAVLFILSVIHHEWKRGFFRKRWKDKEKIRAYKLMKRTEVKNNGMGYSNNVAVPTGKSRVLIGSSSTNNNSVAGNKKGEESQKE